MSTKRKAFSPIIIKESWERTRLAPFRPAIIRYNCYKYLGIRAIETIAQYCRQAAINIIQIKPETVKKRKRDLMEGVATVRKNLNHSPEGLIAQYQQKERKRTTRKEKQQRSKTLTKHWIVTSPIGMENLG